MTRFQAGAFGLAGVFFLLYPVLRPYSDETTVHGLTAMGTTAWITSHLFAVAGFVLVAIALPVRRAALVAAVGAGLTLPYYGAEVFGLHAIGLRAAQDPDPALLELVDAVRYQPAAITMFGVGLLLLAAGAILAAVELKALAIPYAVAFALFLPQFFMPPAGRIAHGVLMLVGCVLVGWKLVRTR
ncbi:hypothetical protein ABZ816_14570 [Actinosynnema sp. NPDC047251]|uniref:Putative secreted protein n=1 Tax=Saccharothrix espanaensis (strain ATCC 51144 / DSM 44229 / JCM 9112 / NBRC 15066 / NRRL 15764) TaxID=1179773 RepID=K0JWA1_SACES|nr:hypothetical protein [Saccharothrix espanaensis]CCH29752.1 putative secreted protein [Saccharothrix espanaensis DSM 44229]